MTGSPIKTFGDDKLTSDLVMIYDVIIIGAGAAGLMSAISAKERGKSVLILESNSKPGSKILISGGGRCNFTNKEISEADFVSNNPHFCKSSLHQFTQNDFIQWMNDAKIAYYEKTLGQLFCKTSSKQILDLLLEKALGENSKLKTGIKIKSVQKKDGFFGINTERAKYQSKNLIIATGGLSFPKLGASDFGYRVAKQFGHSITPLDPALDGFVFSKKDRQLFGGLAGISLNVSSKAGKRSFMENILFTHIGISGPAALKSSLFWYKGEEVGIDFLPHIPHFLKWIEKKQKEEPKKIVANVLSQELPTRFAEHVVKDCKLDDVQMANLSKKQAKQLEQGLKKFSFIPQSTVGYEKAEVTRGGVDTKDISSKTMESKLVPGLYFVGEVLDVTGLLGGYNFQWAWSSG
ncbi:MAG: NAD(P)/FAD-dependent oxidoreductase, partial [Deltaproteobacteria bacterium]|nr:NAD(P)/FAD-dependent oxidoreductase [Deltaproteobacteria bacterium]